MKKTITSILMLTLGISSLVAQTPQFDWATTHGGSGFDTGNSIISDAQGNSYITGSYSGTADFDPTAGTLNQTVNGNSDVYLMKLDNAGNLVWVKTFGGAGYDNALFIDKDQNGNLFIGGYFEGTVDFDPSAIAVSKTSNGMRDMFVSKFDSNGNLIWAHTLGSSSMEMINDGYVDGSGNIFLTGEYGALMDFDPTAGYTSMSCQGTDGFVLKLNGDGSFGFARKIGGIGNDPGNVIKRDEQGMIIVAGTFNAPVDFDNGPGTFNVNPAGVVDMYLVKLSPLGDFILAGSCGGTFSEVYPKAVAIGANNDIYVCGFFSGAIDLDPGSSSNSFASNGSMDAFVIKVNSSLGYTWGTTFGAAGTDSASDIVYTNGGDLILTGAFSYTVDFDPGTGVSNASTSGGPQIDVFLLGLSDQGTFNFVQDFGGDYHDNGNALYLSSTGDLFLTGNHISDVDMDPGTGVSMIYSAETSTPNTFVSKFSTCSPNTGTDVQSACFSYTWIDGNTYTSNNNTATHLLTNVGGCDSLVTLNLTIMPLPDLGITTTDNTLTVAATGLQYQWVDCDNGNAAISGATNQSYIATQNGNYAVIVTNGTCSEMSECESITTIGLEELATTIHLYPNPTNGLITFNTSVDYTIYSISGMELMSGKAQTSADLSKLPAAVYLIEMQNGEFLQRARVVKE